MVKLALGLYLKKKRQPQIGFTLIEVLVALAIVAIALAAVIKASSESIRANQYLEEKTVAMYVAQQSLNEARLNLVPLDAGIHSQQTEMLDKTWHVEIEKAISPNPHIKKILVRVYKQSPDDSDADPIISMETFVYVNK